MEELGKKLQKEISRRKFIELMGKIGLSSFTLGVINLQTAGAAWAGGGGIKVVPISSNNPSIVWDESKCKRCGKCLDVCKNIQTVFGYYQWPANESVCVHCGQCVMKCPQKALTERDDTAKVWQALNNSQMHVVVQTAPSSRVSLGEEFGLRAGTNVEGKQVAALKGLGFDAVFDTNFTADLTIMEEATELVQRLTGAINKPTPQFTSCSPGWVKFCEYFYPDLLPNMSTAKSPMQMMGALVKTYYAQQKGIDPANIFTVSVMPCTAKKYECTRPEMNDAGSMIGKPSLRDVDAVITTRELARMINSKGINLTSLTDAPYDSLLGESTGAGLIFGASGGVMEAAIRTAYHMITNQTPSEQLLNLTDVRGLTGIKESSVNIPGFGNVNVAVCQGLGNARKVLDRVRSGDAPWHFIEFMACPGGCVGGGGQPKTSDGARRDRQNSLYSMDANIYKKRLSYENLEIKLLYQRFLGEPMSETAHKLLHTDYTKRNI